MSAVRREFSQIPTSVPYYVTIINTVWMYPPADVKYVLERTTTPYEFDGTNMVFKDLDALISVQSEIYQRTSVTQPVGNTGYTLGAGSLLQDMGKTVELKLASGEVVVRWRLVKQLTPQQPETIVPIPGNSPPGTVAYVTTFQAYGLDAGQPGPLFDMDPVRVVRVG